ncbi:MAG TPA: ATP-binding protein [Micromonosporaceae bacterium]|jgi:anti-sigma regulatory factor (Ser/Thr protein kinase)
MPNRDSQHAIGNGGGVSPQPPEPAVLDQRFDGNGLYALRAAVSAHAAMSGAPDHVVEDVVVIANELASNAVRHGGGNGRLLMWRNATAVHCRVIDRGPGMSTAPTTVGTHRAPPRAPGGRGLWIVRQLSHNLDVATGPEGTTVTATVLLDNVQA